MAAKSNVGDYVSLQRGTTYKGTLVGKPGPALLGLGSIRPGGGFREGDYKTYGGECPEKLMLFPGDLFVSLKGATKDGEMIGSVARVPSSVPSGRLTQDTVKLVFHDSDPETADYLYWSLRTPQYREYCAARATGSAVVALSREDFLSYPIPTATPARMHLVNLFEAVERKIEVNRLMNGTLEGVARALFKSWFVDFDPVRAKDEGRDPRLTKHLADLFPDSLTESELGKIPATWSVKKLGHLIELAYGKALKEENRRPGNIAVYGSNGQVGWHNEKLANAPGVIVGRKGNPGVVTWASTHFFAIDTTFYVVPQGECKSLYFLFYALRGHDLASLGADSAVPGLNRNMVYMSQQLVPSTAVLDAFDLRVRPIFERIQKGSEQSFSLTALRDTLLPKLLSGGFRLRDAERIVGGQM